MKFSVTFLDDPLWLHGEWVKEVQKRKQEALCGPPGRRGLCSGLRT